MLAQNESERESVLNVVWLDPVELEDLNRYASTTVMSMQSHNIFRQSLPLNLPWSQSFYLCCQDVRVLSLKSISILTFPQIRSFIQKFYQFVEGVSQHHRNIDDLLSKVCMASCYDFRQLMI